MADVKFCGLTRPEDARAAAELGAAYVGVIFAGGPRNLTVERARIVLAGVGPEVSKVGVFGPQEAPASVARTADELGLRAVQLHGTTSAVRVEEVRRHFGGEVWAVVRLQGAEVPAEVATLFTIADRVVLDALVPGGLGGSGIALPWEALVGPLTAVRHSGSLVLAGGLRPENVAVAIGALAPDVVDVSSGVEAAPGIKDHQKMRSFRDAVRSARSERVTR